MLPANQTVSTGERSYTKPAVMQQNAGHALDGFSRKAPRTAHPKTTAHGIHHKTEKSKTLMRHAVKKPTAPKPAAAKSAIRKPAAQQMDIDKRRAQHAEKIQKSHLVSKFGAPRPAVKTNTSVLPVQPAPEEVRLEQHQELFGSKPTHHMVQKALDNASSHTQTHAKKTPKRHKLARRLHISPRTLNLGAASLVAVAIAGFVAYQNVPNVSMKIAAARSGVQGTLPSYHPSGFGLSGPIQYKPGQVMIDYKSHTDQRAFKVSQRVSSWNSDTLLDQYVSTNNRAYQTYQDKGKTIYIFDGSSATWVDGGVWYEIVGNSSLNSDQLLRMAGSM